MDEATARGKAPGRRMASTKPASTTRTTRTTRRSGEDPDAEISPARWAGVALVIAALLGAMILAVVSPSVPGAGGGAPAIIGVPSPGPDANDSAGGELPTAIPEITGPATGTVTSEWYIDVDAAISGEPLPRKQLTLVVLRGDEVIGEKSGPRRNGNDVVPEVQLTEGTNLLTVALRGPGGLGPRSTPIVVTVDRSAPHLEVTDPGNRTKTIEDTTEVVGTSEVGAKVRVTNEAADYDSGIFTVGPGGDFEFLGVRLAKGRNEITVTSQNPTGQPQTDTVVVTRKDGKPSIRIKAPKKLDARSLPRTIKVVVDVKDANGDKLVGAPVSYSLQGPGRPARNFDGVTNGSGRSVWPVEIERGSDPAVIAVTVTSPTDQVRTRKHQIVFE